MWCINTIWRQARRHDTPTVSVTSGATKGSSVTQCVTASQVAQYVATPFTKRLQASPSGSASRRRRSRSASHAKSSKRRRRQSPQPSRRSAKKSGAVKRLDDAPHDESADNSGDDVEPLDEGEHCHAVHMRPNVSRYTVAGRRSASRDRARLPKDARSGEARRKAESGVPSVEGRNSRSDAGDPETPGKSEVSYTLSVLLSRCPHLCPSLRPSHWTPNGSPMGMITALMR